MNWLSLVGLMISGCALGVAGISTLFARRQYRLAEKLRARDFEATVVVELVGRSGLSDGTGTAYNLQMTNAGPAVARDVSVDLTL